MFAVRQKGVLQMARTWTYCAVCKMSSGSDKSHYDTLEIPQSATHSEVKSAYYKLTLKYHPDKNKSELAKKKFQDISDAYEVLGNHMKRKNYDRHMMINQKAQTVRQRPQARTRATQYKHAINQENFKIYDFEEWTRKHYADSLNTIRLERLHYERIKFHQSIDVDGSTSGYVLCMVVAIALIIGNLVAHATNHDSVPENWEEDDRPKK